MFKLLCKVIFLAVCTIVAFVGLSLTSGGEKFRWFGTTVKQESEKVGETADSLKKMSDKVIKGIEGAIEGAKETIEHLIGKKDEKSR